MKFRNRQLLVVGVIAIIITIIIAKYVDKPFKLVKNTGEFKSLQMSETVTQTNTYTEDTLQNEETAQPVQEFTAYEGMDLSLRMFISKVNDKELKYSDGSYIREPIVDVETLKRTAQNTADYLHPKNPVELSVGDTVVYTIRIYNEGGIDTYANSITVHLPSQLEFIIEDELNIEYGWLIDTSLRKVSTNYLAKPIVDEEDKIIKSFNGSKLDYKELKIKCKVSSFGQTDDILTTIAEITGFTDKYGRTSASQNYKDRDSEMANINLPVDEQLALYNGNNSNKSVLTDRNYFYKGQEDDDDFEKLILGEFQEPLWEMVEKTDLIPAENTEVRNNEAETTRAVDTEESTHILLSNSVQLQPNSVEEPNMEANIINILIAILCSSIILLVGILFIKRYVLI